LTSRPADSIMGLRNFSLIDCRIRGFRSNTSVRHLARKESSNRIGSSVAEGFSSSTLTENTYCDGPYSTGDKDLSTNCNIYAELHEPRV